MHGITVKKEVMNLNENGEERYRYIYMGGGLKEASLAISAGILLFHVSQAKLELIVSGQVTSNSQQSYCLLTLGFQV